MNSDKSHSLIKPQKESELPLLKELSPLKSLDDHLKKNIARYIIDEILLGLGGGDELSSKSVIRISSKSDSEFPTRTLTETESSKPELKGLTIDKTRKTRLSSVVNKFELPISLSASKLHVESRPRLERLVLDTHVTTSSTIIRNPEEHEKPTSLQDETHETIVASPFDLCWCFGFNTEVPILNLSNEDISQVVFANSQYAVIYDFHEDTMVFLQGHVNTVSCVSSNLTGNLIVTADCGPDAGTSRLIVWDRRPCVLQVLHDVHPYGCQHVALSPRGDFVVTVSASATPTSFKVWEWERDSKVPAATLVVKESLGSVKQLTTHPTSNREFALTFERSVIFAQVVWQTVFQDGVEEGRKREKIKDCELNIGTVNVPKVGSLTDMTYVEGSETVALSSTCKGYVVVWENSVSCKDIKIYRKYVRLHLECITSIETVDGKIAIATAAGTVSFYDLDLKVLFSHKLFSEKLVSISFNLTSQRQCDAVTCEEHPSCANTWRSEPRRLEDASLKGNPFFVRHFIVSTENGRMAYVNATCGTPKYLAFPSLDVLTSLDVTPNSKYFCVGTASGKCMLFDINRRKLKVTQQIRVQPNTCQAISVLQYSPSGFLLACGMYTGNIWLLDPLLLTPNFKSPLTDSDCCITHLVFTYDSEYLLATDASFCTFAYFLDEDPILLGQYIVHQKRIVALVAETPDPGEKQFKVFTVSSDRHVCQFIIDLENKSFNFMAYYTVEVIAQPMYSTFCPTLYSRAGTYIGVNNEFKFRLHEKPSYNAAKNKTYKRARGTFRAPDFGSPINYMENFVVESEMYIFLKTAKHIGIHNLPIDGNPFRALGFKASPTEITCSRVTPDGRYVFTISEYCSGISMWKINTRAVDDHYRSGGDGLEPFLKMLSEEEKSQIREFFDLGQFLHQGHRLNLVRNLKNSLPICEIASVLLALGCLLTKFEINELTNDVIAADVDNRNSIEYDDFVRLYCNYRMNKELDIRDLRKAFREFYAGVYDTPKSSVNKDPVFDSLTFMEKLLTTGDDMTVAELYTDFSILTGGPSDLPDDSYLMFQIPPTMPKEITFKTFAKDILGFDVDDTVFEEEIFEYKL